MSERRHRRDVLTRAAAALAAAALPAFGARGAQPREHHVAIRGFVFEPQQIDARPGDSVIWTNHDIVPHTATALDGRWDTGKLEQGESARLVVSRETPGPYLCLYHPAMRGSIKAR